MREWGQSTLNFKRISSENLKNLRADHSIEASDAENPRPFIQ